MGMHTAYKFRHYRPTEDGQRALIWGNGLEVRKNELIIQGSDLDRQFREAQDWNLNALANEGEVDMLDVYFDSQAVRTTLYFGLLSAAPGETTTEATMSEISGTGYARIAVTRGTDWGVPTHAGGTASATKTFTAGGTWTAATDLSLSTSSSGTAGLFIAWSALSATRTLINLDTLDVDMTVSAE